jgi:glycyl-tRNA synthetase beta chain
MSNFLLEILSEEIPAKMQKMAAENLAKIAAEIFAKNNFSVEKSQIKSFVTPRRLTLYITDLPENWQVAQSQKIGPKINADKKAIEGFLRSVSLQSEDQLQKIENNGQLCYLYVKPASEIKTAEIIKNSLPQILQKITAAWPKLMRFDISAKEGQAKWIRPIRNIACVFGSEIIDIEFAGLKSNNLTFGHFLKSSEALKIDNALHYEDILKDNFVILDQVKRKEKIITEIRKITHNLNLSLIDSEEKSALFDEVTGLCEWPTALVASIDHKFMALPEEALILTLKLNQKYFCLKNHEEHLVPQFIFIANSIISDSNKEKIISDNEKLVKARLSDVEFFIAEDLKHPLISRLSELKKVVFHQKLGSIYDKTLRMESLAKFLSVFVPHCDLSLIEKATGLCKADLLTKAVAELPELQGKIGSFYAHKQNENKKIVAAIYEHYLPLGIDSETPQTALGIALSIAEKIDSIVGFFLADEKPTSSKDPYALRRATLGIIRISFQHNIAFPIRILVEKSFNAFPTKLLKSRCSFSESGLKTLLDDKKTKIYDKKKLLVEEVIIFFVERLKSFLKENEMLRADIVNAVIEEYLSDLDAHKYCDILYLAKKIKFLDKLLKNKEHQKIIELYKRSANILAVEEKKDQKKYVGRPHLLSLKNKYERTLYRRIKQISREFKKLIIKGEFETAFKLLHLLEAPLTHFFDHVIVNDPDKNLRENRLLLLSKIRSLFNHVADLSKIEIS